MASNALALLIWGKGINEYKFMQVQQDLEIHSLKIKNSSADKHRA